MSEYIESKCTLLERIKAIDSLIDSLLLVTVDNISNSGTASLSMDDGQMKVNTTFRSVDEVSAGIFELEKIKQLYVNRYNGRGIVMRGRANY